VPPETEYRSVTRPSLIALLATVVSCAAQNPRSLSRADIAAGCSDRTPAPCEPACFRGSAAACAIFGSAVTGTADAPVRLPQDIPRARKALQMGCQLGSLDACTTLIDINYEMMAPGAGCAGWEDICKRGSQRSCTFFAQCLDYNEHFRRDKAEALRLFREGCDRGERVACRQLGFRYTEGDGVPKDLVKGFALLDRACRMDDPHACGHAGLRLERGQGTPRDLERAKTLYRMACARGIRPIPCAGLRRLGEVPPSTVVSSADAAESNYVSARFGFEWRIPANWQFVPPNSIVLTDVPEEAEAVVARPRDGSERESLFAAIRDCSKDAAGTSGTRDDRILDALERDAVAWLAGHRIAKTKSVREEFYWSNAVRIEARLAPPDSRFLTVTLFCKDGRRFELRCLSARQQLGTPCPDALGALVFHAPQRDPDDNPRVLHLRDKRFAVSFDAPDDSWLAVGPHANGGHVGWYWFEGDREIDVAVMQVGAVSDEAFDRLVDIIARGKDGPVARSQSELGGRPCVHLSNDTKNGKAEDAFIQRRGDFAYALTVKAPNRDADLLARARTGLRFE
jgi:hypothetical protein